MSLRDTLTAALAEPATTADVDLHEVTDQALRAVGLSTRDAGGELTFTGGTDPFVASRFKFGTAASAALAAKSVATAALWKNRGGEDQDIEIDVRKAFRRFAGFMDLRWETVNDRPPPTSG